MLPQMLKKRFIVYGNQENRAFTVIPKREHVKLMSKMRDRVNIYGPLELKSVCLLTISSVNLLKSVQMYG